MIRRGAPALLAAAALVLGCGSKKDKSDEEEDREEEESGPGLGSLGMMSALFSSQLDQPGRYQEQAEKRGKGDGRWAIVEVAGQVTELQTFSLLGGGGQTLELQPLLVRLAELARDDDVKGLLLRVGPLEVDAARGEELRGALLAFKAGGARRVICHAEALATTAYFVLTACDRIAVAPGGELMIAGVAALPIHIKGLLDKLGVRADFLHIGAFKGAAEPLTRDEPSAEMLETIDAILDQEYATLVAGIAEGRKLDPAAVQRLIDTAIFTAEAARAAKLIDAVATFPAFRDQELDGAGWKREPITPPVKPDMQGLMRMIGLVPPEIPDDDHVALVYAVGDVVDGDGNGMIGAREQIASRPLSAALQALAADDDVKAVVLRIDSPGGSALASEQIWQAVAQLKARKPVVASMAGVAASGGYYIACGATKILADRTTLTGSIGVVGGKLAVADALAGVGVRTYPRGRGKRALLFASLGPWTDDEREAVRALMQGTYDTFVDRVAAGRARPRTAIEPVAQGRVWTGEAARKHGLIDGIGGLTEALAEARTLGGVDADTALEIYPPTPSLLDLVQSFGQVSLPVGVETALAAAGRHGHPRAAAAVRAALVRALRFADRPVQAVAFLPSFLR